MFTNHIYKIVLNNSPFSKLSYESKKKKIQLVMNVCIFLVLIMQKNLHLDLPKLIVISMIYLIKHHVWIPQKQNGVLKQKKLGSSRSSARIIASYEGFQSPNLLWMIQCKQPINLSKACQFRYLTVTLHILSYFLPFQSFLFLLYLNVPIYSLFNRLYGLEFLSRSPQHIMALSLLCP